MSDFSVPGTIILKLGRRVDWKINSQYYFIFTVMAQNNLVDGFTEKLMVIKIHPRSDPRTTLWPQHPTSVHSRVLLIIFNFGY